MRNLYCLILFIYVSLSFGQIKSNTDTLVLEVTMKSFGKCKPLPNEFYKITGLKNEDITSAFYVTLHKTNDVISVPVNDKVFNYDYFYKNIYNQGAGNKKIKLTVKQFIINNEKNYVVCKVQ